jgi:hypothetical protein
MKPELQEKVPAAARPRGLRDIPTEELTDLAGRRDALPRQAEVAT